ncbi:degenerin deg-1-like [Brachionus plicatilis]|uniref:Degenerin deg-1-like n=1 Tax=Brachionus plicatilis TaxID=10195 RepID=A0A3M7QTK4_BRAPC|nr:degenerin deg-1-like [Brachionus plicatilis]
MVHNHSDTISINDFGEEAAAGFSTQVKISRSVYEKMDQPFRTCLSDLTSSNSKQTKIIQIMLNQLNFKKYSKEICLNICFQLKLENECNCSDPSIASIQNMTKCNSIKQIKCKEEFYQSFFSNQSQECEDDCPIECVTYKYSTKLTFSEFYTNWYFDLFQNRIDDIEKDISSYGSAEVARKNVLLINFYYDETSITKITEKPLWNFFSILSSIGGNLGLFIGMSILSCAEIIEIIVKTIFLNFKHTLKMNKLEFVEKISSK